MPEDFIRLIEERNTGQPIGEDSVVEENAADSEDYYNQLLDKYQGE